MDRDRDDYGLPAPWVCVVIAVTMPLWLPIVLPIAIAVEWWDRRLGR